MYHASQIELPPQVVNRLRHRAGFAQSFSEFTARRFAGMDQPVAAAFAALLPLVVAVTYVTSDALKTLEVAATFTTTATLFLLGGWYTNRHRIRAAFEAKSEARQWARKDLKAGSGILSTLKLDRPPAFFEHEHGVIALAEVTDGKTVYFDIPSDGEDGRWFLYFNGDMHREQWRWMRLGASGAVTDFNTNGRRLLTIEHKPYVEAPDAWEAISLAFGEPADGDVIDLSFEEATRTVTRLL